LQQQCAEQGNAPKIFHNFQNWEYTKRKFIVVMSYSFISSMPRQQIASHPVRIRRKWSILQEKRVTRERPGVREREREEEEEYVRAHNQVGNGPEKLSFLHVRLSLSLSRKISLLTFYTDCCAQYCVFRVSTDCDKSRRP
jgi:hypothetical protein